MKVLGLPVQKAGWLTEKSFLWLDSGSTLLHQVWGQASHKSHVLQSHVRSLPEAWLTQSVEVVTAGNHALQTVLNSQKILGRKPCEAEGFRKPC